MTTERRFLPFLLTIAICASAAMTNSVVAQELSYEKRFQKAFSDHLPKLYAPDAPISMAYKATKDRQVKYALVTDSEMDTMGMVTPRDDEYVIGLTLTDGSNGKMVAKSKILEMVTEMNTRGGGIRIDTRDPSTEKADAPFIPLKQIWDAVVESDSEYEMTTVGEVPSYEPPKQISDTINKQGNSYGISARDVSTVFLTGIVQLPNKPVNVGDEWNMNIVISPLGTENATAKGTFLGMGKVDGKAYAVLQIDFESMLEDGEGVITEAEIESQSVILFDVEAGNLFKHFTVSEGDMVLTIGDNEMQQSTSGTSIVKRIDK